MSFKKKLLTVTFSGAFMLSSIVPVFAANNFPEQLIYCKNGIHHKLDLEDLAEEKGLTIEELVIELKKEREARLEKWPEKGHYCR